MAPTDPLTAGKKTSSSKSTTPTAPKGSTMKTADTKAKPTAKAPTAPTRSTMKTKTTTNPAKANANKTAKSTTNKDLNMRQTGMPVRGAVDSLTRPNPVLNVSLPTCYTDVEKLAFSKEAEELDLNDRITKLEEVVVYINGELRLIRENTKPKESGDGSSTGVSEFLKRILRVQDGTVRTMEKDTAFTRDAIFGDSRTSSYNKSNPSKTFPPRAVD